MIRLVRRKSAIVVPAGVRHCSDACAPSAVRPPGLWLRPMLLSPAQSWSAEMEFTGATSSQARLSHWRPAALHAYTVYTPACAGAAPAMVASVPASAAIPPVVRLIRTLYTRRGREVAGA